MPAALLRLSRRQPQHPLNPKQPAAAAGIWQTIAGEDGKAGSRDGPIGSSLLNRPTAMCTTPTADLVVVDSAGACLRLVAQDGGYKGAVVEHCSRAAAAGRHRQRQLLAVGAGGGKALVAACTASVVHPK